MQYLLARKLLAIWVFTLKGDEFKVCSQVWWDATAHVKKM